jgi:hypothetical protein
MPSQKEQPIWKRPGGGAKEHPQQCKGMKRPQDPAEAVCPLSKKRLYDQTHDSQATPVIQHISARSRAKININNAPTTQTPRPHRHAQGTSSASAVFSTSFSTQDGYPTPETVSRAHWREGTRTISVDYIEQNLSEAPQDIVRPRRRLYHDKRTLGKSLRHVDGEIDTMRETGYYRDVDLIDCNVYIQPSLRQWAMRFGKPTEKMCEPLIESAARL